MLQIKALIMIIFANVLLDKHIITSETFTALLLMAVVSTLLSVPVVTPMRSGAGRASWPATARRGRHDVQRYRL